MTIWLLTGFSYGSLGQCDSDCFFFLVLNYRKSWNQVCSTGMVSPKFLNTAHVQNHKSTLTCKIITILGQILKTFKNKIKTAGCFFCLAGDDIDPYPIQFRKVFFFPCNPWQLRIPLWKNPPFFLSPQKMGAEMESWSFPFFCFFFVSRGFVRIQ